MRSYVCTFSAVANLFGVSISFTGTLYFSTFRELIRNFFTEDAKMRGTDEDWRQQAIGFF